jgi:MFS family permease
VTKNNKKTFMGAQHDKHTKILNAAVIIAALGYFVDIYDLLLFGFVRVKSLESLGLSGQELTDVGISLFNWQMIGMLLGGVFWGILGDKRGRVSVLYFSIALYSISNIANGFISTPGEYAFCRFFAGIGLAGELGAGITLVSEILPKEKRGYGTMLVASIGLSGALLAWVVSSNFSWQNSYFIGGGLGIALLVFRISVAESGIFKEVKSNQEISRGNFLSLFTNKDRFYRFMQCMLIGSPTWFVVGILITLAPEFAAVKGLEGVTGGNAIAACYTGLILGDILSGLLSQYLKSRLKVMWIFLVADLLAVVYYLTVDFSSPGMMYFAHFLLGISVGFWVIFVTIAAEQFGTNLRATVATSVPNFARGMLVPISMSFKYLKDPSATGSVITAAYIVGAVCIGIAFLSLWKMSETFHKDMDYVEHV